MPKVPLPAANDGFWSKPGIDMLVTAYTDYSSSPRIVPGQPTGEGQPFFRALFVGGAGNVEVKTLLGVNVTFTGVVAGSILPICAVQVVNDGTTTATNIVEIF